MLVLSFIITGTKHSVYFVITYSAQRSVADYDRTLIVSEYILWSQIKVDARTQLKYFKLDFRFVLIRKFLRVVRHKTIDLRLFYFYTYEPSVYSIKFAFFFIRV